MATIMIIVFRHFIVIHVLLDLCALQAKITQCLVLKDTTLIELQLVVLDVL